MKIVIISLFISIAGHSYAKQFVRWLLSKVTKHPIEYWMTRTEMIIPIDCFPCFTWWIACIVSTASYLITNQIEYLPAMIVFIMASIYSKL